MTILCLEKKKAPPLCINGKAAAHLHVMSQITGDNSTSGTRIQVDNPDFTHSSPNTELYPISNRSKAKLLFLLHQAVVPGCPAKRHRHQAEMVSVENPNKQTAKESEDL